MVGGLCFLALWAIFEWDKRTWLRANVLGAWTNDFIVLALLDDMGRPACGACNNKKRGKHQTWNAHQMVDHDGIPVEVGKHLFFFPHGFLYGLGNIKETHITSVPGQGPGDSLDHLLTRIGDRIDRMAEADDGVTLLQAVVDVIAGLCGAVMGQQYV